MKKLLVFIVLILIIIVGVYLFGANKSQDDNILVEEPKSIQLCFYQEGPNKTPGGYYDIAWLKMNLTGDKVMGEFRNYPAEKDSKVGTFTGVVGEKDPYMMARVADVTWNALQEGMQTKEQLRIIFGEGTANAYFGEMVDQGNGVYVYKDLTKLTAGMSMTDVACSDIDDRLLVEKYVRDNIQTLVPEKPVLGGSWYALNISVNPRTKTGTMAYEDGHIKGEKTFSYSINNGAVSIVVK